MPGVANWVNRLAPVRTVMNRVLGLDRRRTLPEFRRALTAAQISSRPGINAGGPVIALFADCFTTHNETGVGLAAKAVLEAFGYRVRLVNAGCCGRAMISTGMLARAIQSVDSTLERLQPVIEDDAVQAVVVCEPSCLSAIKDDWLQLKLAAPLALRQKQIGRAHV